MHEAGLAAAIADALRKATPLDEGTRIRLLVSGGHDEPDDFDAALRLHLRGMVPDLEPALEIEHVAVERLCVGCGDTYGAVSAAEPCPACGGSALPLPVPERVDIEVRRPANA